MARDAASASLADGRRCLVGFLNHRAYEAGEIWQPALQELPTKGDIGDDTIQRIGMVVIGRIGKQRARHLGPVVRRGNGECILAFEMVEECALGDARRRAEFVNRSG
jgi:hypothetical protein